MRWFRLIRTDVQSLIVNALSPTLVRRHRRSEGVGIESWITVVNRRASRKKGHGGSRSTVVLKRAEPGIDVDQVILGRSNVALEVANKVKAGADKCAENIGSGRRGVACDDGVRGSESSA